MADQDDAYSTFTKGERIVVVFFASMAGLISPLSSQIYFPALNQIAESLDVTIAQINLTLTTFLIFQGISPTIVSDFADTAGRRPAYLIAYIVYVIANIGLGLQNNYPALLVLRAVQSMGSSGTIALAYAMVADISTPAQRGKYMGFTGAGILLGPSIGPIFGGLISQYLGWHAIFWALLIFSGVLLIFIVFFLPETGRNIVGDGSIPPPKWHASVISRLQRQRKLKGLTEEERTRVLESDERKKAELASKRRLRFPNPLKTMLCIKEKDIGLLLFTNSLVFTAFYCVIGSLPQLLNEIYGFDAIIIGLCFVPFGFGCAAASVINGRIMDANYRRIARKYGLPMDKRNNDIRNFPIEIARLQCSIPLLYVGILFYIVYGWLLDFEVHPAAPLTVLFFLGLFISGSFSIGNNFLVDLYPKSSATATSANNFVRCLVGAGGTALINPMLAAMGRGWCFTFIALVMLLCSPAFFVILKKGPKWREERYVRMEKAEAAKQQRESVTESIPQKEEQQNVNEVDRQSVIDRQNKQVTNEKDSGNGAKA